LEPNHKDFCFLQQTKARLVIFGRSTFAWWAAYLSEAVRIDMYRVYWPGAPDFGAEFEVKGDPRYHYSAFAIGEVQDTPP
jgi:hypothetical protein